MAYAYIKRKLKKSHKVVILGKQGRSYDDLVTLSHKLKINNDCIFTDSYQLMICPYSIMLHLYLYILLYMKDSVYQ